MELVAPFTINVRRNEVNGWSYSICVKCSNDHESAEYQVLVTQEKYPCPTQIPIISET